jgi:hypothetical protein
LKRGDFAPADKVRGSLLISIKSEPRDLRPSAALYGN